MIEAASDYYEREFDIRMLTQSVSAWPETERIPSTPTLLLELKKSFHGKRRPATMISSSSFTAENISRYSDAGRPRVDRIGNCSQGLANYIVVPISKVFQLPGSHRRTGDSTSSHLVHELGHVFGAEHVEDINSLMHEDFGYRTEFDAKNRAIIQKNRSCPFAK